MALTVVPPPYTLKGVESNSISGEYLQAFARNRHGLSVEWYKDFFFALPTYLEQIEGRLKGKKDDVPQILSIGIDFAVKRAYMRAVKEYLSTDPEQIDSAKLVELTQSPYITDLELRIIDLSFVKPHDDGYWCRRDFIERSFKLPLHQLHIMGFYPELARQEGRLHSLLIENMISSFSFYQSFLVHLELDNVAKVPGLNIQAMQKQGDEGRTLEETNLFKADWWIKSYSKAQKSKDIRDIANAEKLRMNYLYYFATLNGEGADVKMIEAFREVFAQNRFAGFDLVELEDRMDDDRPIQYNFHPTVFVDAVEARFLTKLSHSERIEFKRETSKWLQQAAAETKIKLPSQYQGNGNGIG